MPRGRVVIEPLEQRTLLTVVGGGFDEVIVGTGLRQPTAMAVGNNAGDPIFISEKAGRVRVSDGFSLNPQPAFVLQSIDATGDRGLLGIAVSRNYSRDHWVYLNYTAGGSQPHQRISRVLIANGEALASSEQILLDLPAWDGTAGQYGDGLTDAGGGMHFMFDGTLLVGVGDAGKKENASNLDSPFGKMLRLKPDGGVPADNPFATADGIKRYVWASGLHNPTSFAVTPENGITYINDAGAQSAEEINLASAGANYGWPSGEGLGFGKDPLHVDPHQSTDPDVLLGQQIGGGVVFSPGAQVFPVPFAGDYFYTDRQANVIRVLNIEKFVTKGVQTFATNVASPMDMVRTPTGELLCISAGTDGQLIRYSPNGLPGIIQQPVAGAVAIGATLALSVEVAGQGPFTYQWQQNGVDIPNAVSPTYSAGPVTSFDDGLSFTVMVRSVLGSITSQPAIVRLSATGGTDGGGTGTGGTGTGTGTGTGGTDGTGSGGTGTGGSGTPNVPGGTKNPPAPQGPFDLAPLFTTPVGGMVVGSSAGRTSLKVYNLGSNTSPDAFTVKLFLSTDTTFDSGDLAVTEYSKSAKVKPRGAKSIKIKFAYPAAADGLYYLIAQVATTSASLETDLANNTAFANGQIRVEPASTDLRSTVGATHATARAGKSTSVPLILTNTGNVVIEATITVVVALSTGSESAGATGVAAAEAIATASGVYTRTVKIKLAPGKSKQLKLKVAMPADLAAGAYTFVASADTTNVLSEADETNNVSVAGSAVVLN